MSNEPLPTHDDPLLDLYTHPNNDCRVWVGNLDPRVTEFELVKLFQNVGKIDKLEYLFHKIGPYAGQPRGYAFLTFNRREDAVKARKEFDGKRLFGKTLLVKPARNVTEHELSGSKTNQLSIPALTGAKDTKHKLNLDQQIKAIESKLNAMENASTSLPEVPSNFISPLSCSAARSATQAHSNHARPIRTRRMGSRGASRTQDSYRNRRR